MEIELSKEEKIEISNSEDIYQIMLKILEREKGLGIHQEHFWVIGLSEKDSMLIFVDLVALGSSKRFVVDPKEVFYMAVHKHLKHVVLIHNHPAGVLKPSEADKDLTDKLIHAAELLSLEVIEHLIISEKGFYSFSRTGLLYELGESKKYAVYFIEEEKLLKRGKREKAIEMAKGMKLEKIDIKIIEKLSGISKEEIQSL